ncbi:MAG: helix-hairpin-helix domain-containing protein [Chloroflexi bacterium]|nr:helix-hairpin-helix domain-containing protein [Chloroflexota bacterium]
MDAIVRLKTLTEQMSLEQDGDASTSAFDPRSTSINAPYLDKTENCPDAVFVHPAILPNGQKIKLLKTLLTSTCERDCYYCPFRAGRDMRRATFQPEEFARLFLTLAAKGVAAGVFLSSGMAGGGVRSQDKLLDTADILRHKLNFHGYIHLKVLPGAEKAQVERAMLLADRVSVNLEAPNDTRLAKLAPHKQFVQELLQPLKWMEEIRRSKPGYVAWKGHWPSSVTQFVAGGAGETDLELLTITGYLYRHLGLKRAYFSPFNPIPDTPLEGQPPTPVIRGHRLYQASFLIQDYGFEVEELPFETDGRLPVHTDPKLAWARKNLAESPVEVNQAERQQLMRVPGIGPKGVEAILRARRQGKIRDLSVLKKMGVLAEKAAPFLLLDGQRAVYQPALF